MRAYHHGNLREALVTAGMRAVAESGLEQLSLRDVARRAGVTAPAVYRHFTDKDALIEAIAAACADRMFATIGEAIARAANDDALTRFRAAGVAYVQFAVAHPEHFRAMAVPGLLARLPADHRLHAAKAGQRADLARGQGAGVIADLPLDELLLAANALVHGLACMIVEGQLGDVGPKRATELAIAVTGVLGCGLFPRRVR
jgi:AcrR family transcriptional regulator